MTMRVRAAALTVAALMVVATAVGCDAKGAESVEGDSPSPGDAKNTAASPTEGGSPLPVSLTGQRPVWGDCKAPEGGERPAAAWRCTRVKVPLDYAKPSGPTISVALIRKEARDKDRRIGSLLFNFGGPGASGVDILPRMAGEYEKLGGRYDLVGFDPRGVSRSSGVVCRDDKEIARSEASTDLTPETDAEAAAYIKDNSDFSAGCARRSGTVIPHVGTSNAARDLDLVRQVLGDDKLHYFGISYGTQLGAAYAHLFPKNVGRAVLDAVIDPTGDSLGHARGQATGFQRALGNYLTSTGEDPKKGTDRIAKLLAKLDRSPLPTADGRKLTDGLALTGIALPLYSKTSWPYLTEALNQAEQGKGEALLALADSYNDRDKKGHYGTQSHSQRAISCADSSLRPTPAQAKALLPEFRKISPVFGEFLAWDTAGWCADWPVKGEHDTPPASAPGAAPILVVGTTGDPATPYEGARRMADELGQGVGVLLTNRGEGHGAYGTASCVTKTIDAYLLDGKVPTHGTTCS
ncbi:alpha/beta hydrolase [Streptomyces purpureus]|uniref:alpha/beta hydrolase n=1 Tax=Streptomyces purpureus TaxID=1951 RepID=UPI0003761252|nr:alpha/beta hydrolase [Streptomyces purpureus]